ncbi:hypothetical protein R7P80_02245 [Vibrio sp. 2092]|uniref:hypothetical protein n=1 Tax=Vibrio sp. 2092 TaxID=3074593 RepID=UPI001A28ABDC|nr:hypothetical protein [Vibrio sp. 2092]MCA2471601.1 hypothetical protein [Vibrio alginolyticus]MDW2151621.1 hypothetical protein [Vibrio sp. 2092]HAT8518397.1 hypothetical protein [Vibrio vulnificus]
MQISEIQSKKLDLELINIKLIQREKSPPITIIAKGTLKQDEHGVIQLTANSLTNDYPNFTQNEFNSVGFIKPEHEYFDLYATDHNGVNWKAERLGLKNNINDKSNLFATVTMIKRDIQISNNVAEFKSIMCFSSTNLRPNKIYVKIGKSMALINIKSDFVEVFIQSESSDLIDKISNCIYKPISMLLGKQICPISSELYVLEGASQKIYSKNNDIDSQSLFPILGYYYNNEDAKNFIESYVRKLELEFENNDSVFPRWHDSLMTNRRSIHSGLYSCSAQIEGLIDSYFQTMFEKDDRDYLTSLDGIIEAVESIEKCEAREHALSRLSSMKRKSPSTVAVEICNKIAISTKLAKTWSKVRNKKLHSTVMEYDNATLKKDMLRMHMCHYFMYRLIFEIIGYKGHCVDYSKEGFPIVKVE